MTTFSEHTSDTNNPHEVNKDQVGLSYINNYRLATEEEVLALERDDRYIDKEELQLINQAFKKYLKDLGLIDEDGNLIVIPSDIGSATFAIDSSGMGWLEGEAYRGDHVEVEIFKDEGQIFDESNIQTQGDDHSWEADLENEDFNHGDDYKAVVRIFEGGHLIAHKTVDWIDGDLALYEAHMEEENPHLISPFHVGLGLVENHPPSTPYSGTTSVEQQLDEWGFVPLKYY